MPVSVDVDSFKPWDTGKPLKVDHVTGVEPMRVGEIAPAAVHIKELNNIDPFTIESLHVSEVKNIDPIVVEKFNVTHLPTVNLSVRQLPSLEMNVRRLPPVSIGLNQDIHVPSDYTVRARLFGIEIFRMQMAGHTMLVPRDKARREQSRTHERSFPETAAAGNPAIPTTHEESCTVVTLPHHGGPCCVGAPHPSISLGAAVRGASSSTISGEGV